MEYYSATKRHSKLFGLCEVQSQVCTGMAVKAAVVSWWHGATWELSDHGSMTELPSIMTQKLFTQDHQFI